MHAGALNYSEMQNFHCCWKESRHKILKWFLAMKTVSFKWENSVFRRSRCCRISGVCRLMTGVDDGKI